MGRKKVQRNTLALWAGVKVAGEGDARILTFKIDADKLRQRQARPPLSASFVSTTASVADTVPDTASVRSLANGSAQESSTDTEGSVTTLQSSKGQPKSEPHPFFSKRKPVVHSHANGEERSTAHADTDVVQKSTTTHSFFKPRPTSAVSLGGETVSKAVRLECPPAPLPTRATMHVRPECANPLPKISWRRTGSVRRLAREERQSRGSCLLDDEPQEDSWARFSRAMRIGSHVRRSKRMCLHEPHPLRPPDGTSQHRAVQLAQHKLSGPDDGTVWTTRFAPRTAEEVLQDGPEAFVLRDWLKSRRLHGTERLQVTLGSRRHGLSSINKYADLNDDFIVDDEIAIPATSDIGAEFDHAEVVMCPPGREQLFKSNIVVVTGPTGCGKSAAIQAVAWELDFEIFEMNPMDRRSAKDVVESVGEAAQSQMVNKKRTTNGKLSKSMLLFEEVDVLYRDDRDFWNAVLALVASSKRPIVLTCNDVAQLPSQLDVPGIHLQFKPPCDELATDYLVAISSDERGPISRGLIEHEWVGQSRDLRASINSLQFMSLADHCDLDMSTDLMAHEVLSEEMSAVDLFYHETRRTIDCDTTSTKASLQDYRHHTRNLSLLDVLATQQRSMCTEEQPVFENDNEDDLQARAVERDDTIGPTILSHPYGRFTRLHPGDLNPALSMAFAMSLPDDAHKAVQPVRFNPLARHLSLKCLDDTAERAERFYQKMVDACAPFEVPEKWMFDTTPPNSINRSRISGILATDVMPYLRHMVYVDDQRARREAELLGAYAGRTTRNTMGIEYGAFFKMPSKVPLSLRKPIIDTFIAYTA